jgi:hypothetical protein
MRRVGDKYSAILIITHNVTTKIFHITLKKIVTQKAHKQLKK